MNTKQLIVTWYVGLLLTVHLIFDVVEGVMTQALLSAGTILLAALVLYTVKPHPALKKKRVLWLVVGPVVVGAVVMVGVSVVVARLPTRIPIEQIQFTHSMMKFVPDGSTLLNGQIYNSSQIRVMGVEIEYKIYDLELRSRVIDELIARIDLSVPPGESQSFTESVRFRQAGRDAGLSGSPVIQSQELLSVWGE